ncbi:alpha/beta fold hydrolase [Deinococcus psychrotolerans]|uniref:alpha/beta fold hydrolase n=1 Tax=Deinococcus psychrotolerans TaxID=2489213 RepID=UPI001F14D5B2|nr:alpha/beta hydrolase [Deinococcus psychrotolerans]
MRPPPIITETFSSGTRTLRYTRQGAGPPIILIHGLSGSGRWWRFNAPALAASHEVLTLELLGGVGVQEAARLIGAWMEQLDLPPCAVLGHSMGGQIALYVAAASPQRVSRLILACASGLLHAAWWKVALNLPRAGFSGRPRFMPVVLRDSLRTGLPNLYRSARDLLRDDVEALLPTIQVPTLVIWGSRDPLVPPHLGQLLAQRLPNARYTEIAHAGHVVMVDQPAAFNRAVIGFLAQPLAGET